MSSSVLDTQTELRGFDVILFYIENIKFQLQNHSNTEKEISIRKFKNSTRITIRNK